MELEYIAKKEFEKQFFNLKVESEIVVLKKLNKIPKIFVETALSLSKLDFIKFIRISENEIRASSEVKGARIKIPITQTHHFTATGISVIYHFEYEIIDFDEINSPIKGNGIKMVDCILSNLPNIWKAGIFMDWSGGFWDKMKHKYKNINWVDY